MTNPPRFELVIRVSTDGRIQVSGPIHDKLLCYGLLESARDAIKEHTDKMAPPAIQVARPADPFLMPRPTGRSGG